MGEVIDKAIDCGHAVELQPKDIEEDADVNIKEGQHALADLEGIGALHHRCTRGQLGVEV